MSRTYREFGDLLSAYDEADEKWTPIQKAHEFLDSVNEDEIWEQRHAAADALFTYIAELEAERRWIPVSERLPEAERKEFCPNCESETPCTHEAELFVCDICGEDFAKYIVSRNCNVSDVSMTQDVLTDVKTPRSIENNNPDYYKDELYLDEDFRMLSKTYPADVSAIGVTTLIDYVEALEAELARRDEDALNKRIAELSQAVGLITTLNPTMVMDADHPLDMAKEVVEYMTTIIANTQQANRGLCANYIYELNENIKLTARIAELEEIDKLRGESVSTLNQANANNEDEIELLEKRIAELEYQLEDWINNGWAEDYKARIAELEGENETIISDYEERMDNLVNIGNETGRLLQAEIGYLNAQLDIKNLTTKTLQLRIAELEEFIGKLIEEGDALESQAYVAWRKYGMLDFPAAETWCALVKDWKEREE